MTNSQTLEQFLLAWNSNAYLNMCTSDDMKNVIKALEKQIPKKPTYVDTRFRNHGKNIADGASLSKCYKCPNCSLHIFHVFDSEVYCKHCGQALDWGED
jgi:hypothetical protein